MAGISAQGIAEEPVGRAAIDAAPWREKAPCKPWGGRRCAQAPSGDCSRVPAVVWRAEADQRTPPGDAPARSPAGETPLGATPAVPCSFGESAATCSRVAVDSWGQGLGCCCGYCQEGGIRLLPFSIALRVIHQIHPWRDAAMHAVSVSASKNNPAEACASPKQGNGRRAHRDHPDAVNDWASIKAACCRHRRAGPALATAHVPRMVSLSFCSTRRGRRDMDTAASFSISRGWDPR